MRQIPLTIVQGTPFRFRVRVQKRNEEGIFEPMPLAGCFVRFQARAQVNSVDTLIDLSSKNKGITIDEEAGTFTLYMTSYQTSALKWQPQSSAARPVYQCEVTLPDGESFRVLEGRLKLDPEVVR